MLADQPDTLGHRVYYRQQGISVESPRLGSVRQDRTPIKIPQTSGPEVPLCRHLQMPGLLRAEDHGWGRRSGHLRRRLRYGDIEKIIAYFSSYLYRRSPHH